MSDPDQIPRPPSKTGKFSEGVILALRLHLLQVVIVPLITFGLPWIHPPEPGSYNLGHGGLIIALGFWGLTQLLYLGPATWYAYSKGKRETAEGILWVAGIGILLNGTCDAFLFSGALFR